MRDLHGRKLLRQEVEQVWSIDRSEVTDNVYRLENGDLVLRPEHHDLSGWPPGEADQYTPILLDCFDRGGWFHGLFDRSQLVAVVVLDSERGLHSEPERTTELSTAMTAGIGLRPAWRASIIHFAGVAGGDSGAQNFIGSFSHVD